MEPQLAASPRPNCTQCGRPAFGIFRDEPRCFPHQNHKRLTHGLGARLRLAERDAMKNDDVGLPHDMDPAARELAWGAKLRSADPYIRLARGE